MELTNADGGLAEISGNGLRCLAYVAAGLGLARATAWWWAPPPASGR